MCFTQFLHVLATVWAPADLKTAVKEALSEFKEEKKSKELTFSTCSANSLKAYLTHLRIGLVKGSSLGWPMSTETFTPFVWTGAEEDDTPQAKAHLETQLQKFGVPLRGGLYELYDVHKCKTILSLSDPKTGDLSGGTDLILGPANLYEEGVVQQSCVVFELKTQFAVSQKGFSAFKSQATLELIAANYHSEQMTVVVLSDLYTAAMLFTLQRATGSDFLNVVVYENLTLSQAAQFVATHVTNSCFPSVNYRLGVGTQRALYESEEVLQVFKKARVTPLGDSVVWEHFQEMLSDTAAGTKERAEVIQELYRACDFPQPAWLSMYS